MLKYVNDRVKILEVGFICKRMVSVVLYVKFEVRSELILSEEVLTPCLCSLVYWRFVCELRFPVGVKVFVISSNFTFVTSRIWKMMIVKR